MRLNNTARIFAGFQVPIKAANQPSSPGRLEIFTIFSSSSYNKFTDIFIKVFWQDFLVLLLSLVELRNSVSKLTSLRVFERVFLFFWSSINLSIGLSRDTNLLDCSAILKNISQLLITWKFELRTTRVHRKYNILSKLPDKATRNDREKARENTIRFNRDL